jgi:hypothetical protein
MSAEIVIGGPFPRSLVPELLAKIQFDGAGFDWEETVPETEEDLVEKTDGYPLMLYDDAACNGQFEYLEAFLMQHNIPWDRTNNAKYEYDGFLTCFRPGQGIVEFNATQDGEPLVTLEDVLKIKERLLEVLNGKSWGALKLALHKIDQIAPEIEPLKPFTIVDDEPKEVTDEDL